MKIRLAGQERNLDKESGILVIFAGKQAGDGDHGAIGGIMESSQPVFFCFGGDYETGINENVVDQIEDYIVQIEIPVKG